ncbi:tRNA (adenosine(37)-N6)-threonylcarbamoyltransferase complex dimerization subunit type 1 TsaB [Candidatus Latescibacterota bacterium]
MEKSILEVPRMNILGIETATERLSAALIHNGKVHSRSITSRSSHCELLARYILELVDEAGITATDIQGVSVSLGPGSFTGLRIGIATAMGLAYGLKAEVAGVNTLMAIAWNASKPGALVCPLIDARRFEVYSALYRTSEGVPSVIVSPSALTIPKLADTLNSFDEQVLITGPAAEKFKAAIEERTESSVSFITSEKAQPSGVAVAQIGLMMFHTGNSINPVALKPVYLKKSDAEIARDKCK